MLSNAATIAVAGVGEGGGVECWVVAGRSPPADVPLTDAVDVGPDVADDEVVVGAECDGAADVVVGVFVEVCGVVVGDADTTDPAVVGAALRGAEEDVGAVEVVGGLVLVAGLGAVDDPAPCAGDGLSLVAGVLTVGAVADGAVVDGGDNGVEVDVEVGAVSGFEVSAGVDVDADDVPGSEVAGVVSAEAVPVPAAHAPAIATAPPASLAARTQFRVTLIGVLHPQRNWAPRHTPIDNQNV